MRPSGQPPADKGKGVASSSESYQQTMLGNLNFRPLESLETMERIHFGPFNLIAYPESNISFKVRPDYVLDRP